MPVGKQQANALAGPAGVALARNLHEDSSAEPTRAPSAPEPAADAATSQRMFVPAIRHLSGELPQCRPTISPLSSTSRWTACGSLPRPGIRSMLPAITTTKPAPAATCAPVTVSVHPRGAPVSFGLSDSDDCVLAMQTGNRPKPSASNFCNCLR